MRGVRTIFLTVFLGLFVCASVGAGPVAASRGGNSTGVSGKRLGQQQLLPLFDPDNFRCIVVGDSQTTGPNANGVRTQMHRWDMNFVGDQLTVGNSAAGYQVNLTDGGDPNLTYRSVSMFAGWGDGGPDDFFATNGHEWQVAGNISAVGSRIARFRLNFGAFNWEAPWNDQWGVGTDLVARIAFRTNPNTVQAIQVRPERGETIASDLGTLVLLDRDWGVQVVEQVIPASIDPTAGEVGIGLFFPAGFIEEAGKNLQILGVTIHRLDASGEVEKGSFIGYQGRGSWRVWNHVELLSQESRRALIEMIDPEYIMIMLGHNTEWDGFPVYEPGLIALMQLWEDAFASLNRPRPQFIFMSPWAIGAGTEQEYLHHVDKANLRMGDLTPMNSYISLFNRYDGISPEFYDPSLYNMDSGLVHPADIPTARRIAEDIYQLLFR